MEISEHVVLSKTKSKTLQRNLGFFVFCWEQLENFSDLLEKTEKIKGIKGKWTCTENPDLKSVCNLQNGILDTGL